MLSHGSTQKMSVTSIQEILLSNIVYFTDAKANKLNKKHTNYSLNVFRFIEMPCFKKQTIYIIEEIFIKFLY